ncbi:MAG: type II secretion system F family protein [Patescibacteria group bacterium]
MRFLYKAKDSKGEVVTGTVKAPGQSDAEQILLHHSLVPLEVVAAERHRFILPFGRRITLRDKAIFARLLSTMISAGLPLTKALTIVAAQAQNERLRRIYHDLYRDLEEGASFSRALAKHPEAFDRVFVSVINSGETTGRLDVVLNQLANQLEKQHSFTNCIKSVLYYPVFLLLAMIGVAVYMLMTIVPQLKQMFEQAQATLPLATRMLLAISDFFVVYWWALLIVLLIIGLVLRLWLASESGSRTVNLAKIEVPVLGKFIEGIYIGRFSRVLEMLIGAGVSLLDSLRTSATIVNNEIYEESILNMITRIERGVPLSTELIKNPVFPQMLGQMVAVGEETGQLDKVLGRVADYFEEDTSNRIKTISTLIEPVVLVIIGIGVAFLVFAILVPIYNLAQIQ